MDYKTTGPLVRKLPAKAEAKVLVNSHSGQGPAKTTQDSYGMNILEQFDINEYDVVVVHFNNGLIYEVFNGDLIYISCCCGIGGVASEYNDILCKFKTHKYIFLRPGFQPILIGSSFKAKVSVDSVTLFLAAKYHTPHPYKELNTAQSQLIPYTYIVHDPLLGFDA